MSNLSVSDLWSELRAQAQRALDTEPTLATIVRQTILDQPDFGGALAHRIGHALADSIEQSHTLTDRFAGLHHQLPALAETACCDLQAIVSRDPAFDSALEVFLFSKGFLALQAYRIGHQLHGRSERLLAMYIQARCNERLGIDINPASRIGSGIMLDHGTGIVIGETAVVGDGCTIYHGVTLGGTSLYKGAKRHPTLGRDVVVSAGAKVLGGFEVGDGAKIGSNAVVIKPVPAGATAVGIPARIIASKNGHSADVTEHDLASAKAESIKVPASAAPQPFTAYGITQEMDPVAQAMRGLSDGAAAHEQQIALLWEAIAKLSAGSKVGDCVPCESERPQAFQKDKIDQIMGK